MKIIEKQINKIKKLTKGFRNNSGLSPEKSYALANKIAPNLKVIFAELKAKDIGLVDLKYELGNKLAHVFGYYVGLLHKANPEEVYSVFPEMRGMYESLRKAGNANLN